MFVNQKVEGGVSEGKRALSASQVHRR